MILSRRRLLTAGATVLGSSVLSGCKLFDPWLSSGHPVHETLARANGLTYSVQDWLRGDSLAPEFTEADIRQGSRANGSVDPQDPDYLALRATGFADWRLSVTGLVDRPLSLSLADLRAMPSRTQITRHDCVEGWSCIAKWTGTPLALVLDAAGVRAEGAFVVFRCLDTLGTGLSGGIPYYESIDMRDARHPQTILAWGMNDGLLPVANGAPLRVRVERQLGYKMAKYLKGIEVVGHFDQIGGRGSYWADVGYDWYAGI
jgi:DMSO/TMAO reductase YedYZ molybdopterin-dependent catalytic subunit